MVTTEKEIAQHYHNEEYLLLHFLGPLLGIFMLIFCLLVFIYAPSKTIARYGTVVDIHDYGIALKGNESHVHILLDDGELVTLNNPKWVISENKKLILQEIKPFIWGVKRYDFYIKDRRQPLLPAMHFH
jgi:hypothetical protein